MWNNKKKNQGVSGRKSSPSCSPNAWSLTLICLIAAVMMVLALSGCGSAQEDASAQTSSAASESNRNEDHTASGDDSAQSEPVDAQGAEQTVTVKTEADGTPTKVKIRTEGEDLEADGDPALLPFRVVIRYFLNGEERSAEEMAGVSGEVTIRFEYENKTREIVTVEEEDRETIVPFLFLSAVLLPEEYFSDVSVENGSVTAFQENQIAYGYAMPGWREALAIGALTDRLTELDYETEEPAFPEYVEITAKTTNFRISFTATIVTNGLLKDVSLSSLDDLQELPGKLDELSEAGEEMLEAAQTLTDGTEEFRKYLVQYTDGVSAISSGARQLSAGIGKLNDALSAINLPAGGELPDLSGLSDAAAALRRDGEMISQQLGGLEKISEAAKNLSPEAIRMIVQNAATATIREATEDAYLAAYEAIAENALLTEDEKRTIAETAGQAAGAAAVQSISTQLTETLTEYGIDLSGIDQDALIDTVSDIKTQITILSGYLTALDGSGDLAGQLAALQEGLTALKSGISQLSSGAAGLSQGAATLAGSGEKLVSGYDGIIEGVRAFSEAIQEFNEEGIQKLTELPADELVAVLQSLRALQKADEAYHSFDGTNAGKVRFLLESEEIRRR